LTEVRKVLTVIGAVTPRGRNPAPGCQEAEAMPIFRGLGCTRELMTARTNGVPPMGPALIWPGLASCSPGPDELYGVLMLLIVSSVVVISILGLMAPEERGVAWFGDGLALIGLGLVLLGYWRVSVMLKRISADRT
jgi:hypothetical protein